MSEKQDTVKETKVSPTINIGVALAIGAVFGVALGNLMMGATIGMAVAAAVNAYREKQQGLKGAGAALVISIVGLIVVIAIWVAQAMGWM